MLKVVSFLWVFVIHQDMAWAMSVVSASQAGGHPPVIQGGSPRFKSFAQFLLAKQSQILAAVEAEDGSGVKFQVDPWVRESDGSFGFTTCLEDGDLVEKGAASVSIIHGRLTEERAKAMSARSGTETKAGQAYNAAALSLVFHSRSPLVPTFRADVRYFEVDGAEGPGDGPAEKIGWFGGGADLTPYYLVDDDCVKFHSAYKALCDAHEGSLLGYAKSDSRSLYRDLKARCDDYFRLPARDNERRGVGGIFFDDFPAQADSSEESLNKAQAFCEAVADAWMPSWLPICARQRDLPYTPEQREWQLLRRGRYLEFNLLYDRGVRFGLVPGGRTEAVMVSAPPLIRWKYNFTPDPGSDEEKLVEVLRNPREWV